MFPPFFAHFFKHELAGLDGNDGQDSCVSDLGGGFYSAYRQITAR